MRILVLGGAGYVGSQLVETLLDIGHVLTVYDLFLFGEDVLKSHTNLNQVKGDIRDLHTLNNVLLKHDTVIHLACISNDPSFELNPMLGKSINLDSFEPLVKLCKNHNIKRFIFASSSSVYGIKNEKNVTEDMSLDPLTDYSKFKAECEKILLNYQSNDFICTVLRPATVCGYAPRQRLDVVVNILTNLAYNTGTIKIMGGEQLRPNIHINDMVRAYIHVLNSPAKHVQGETFNVGYDNHSVFDLGTIVKKVVGEKKKVILEKIPTNDHRSYHVSSEKIAHILGFKPKHSIEDAVRDLVNAFENGKLPNSLEDKKYFNIKTMKSFNLE